jgi:trehalose/maltose hydrolase-like predicted phosphorylase
VVNYLHPPIAAAMLQYRTARRGTAEANAESYRLPGLQYPWESTLTGVASETGRAFGPRGQSCETYEIHIGGDIAQAFWRYWAATGDKHWLCSGEAGGRPIDVLRGIALYYSARVVPVAKDQYELWTVTGPDEAAPEVNNSCYVSSIASLTMLAAANLSAICGLPVPGNWTTVPRGLKIPFNATGYFHPEFDGYPYGQQVKQADTIMAFGYPLAEWRAALAPEKVDPVAERNDLIYYDRVTNPDGPAMTWALFAIGWLDIGEHGRALALFRRGYANARAPFQVWTEGADGGGCISFLTGAGGFLQSVINGYLGVRLGAESLILRPVAPPGNATALAVRGLNWHGRRLKLRVDATGAATVEVLSGAPVLLRRAIANSSDTELAVGDAPLLLHAPVHALVLERPAAAHVV